MIYLAVLDHAHLDNSLFLTAFARAVAQHKNPGIILHGDSEYTERIIQGGVMRRDAQLRAMKELNRRLVGLLADEGVAAIGLNGSQKGLVNYDSASGEIEIDSSQIEKLPPQPAIVLSALGTGTDNEPVPVPLPLFAEQLRVRLELAEIVLFCSDASSEVMKQDLPEKASWNSEFSELIQKQVPSEFQNSGLKMALTTADSFAKWPNMGNMARFT